MDVKSKAIDISSFLLFEATGDSETGCFEPAMSAVVVVDDDDDAESCSCDSTASEFLPGVSLEHKATVGDDDEGEVVELQMEAPLHKNRRDDHRRFDGGVRNGKNSSSVSVDSAKPLKEKNSAKQKDLARATVWFMKALSLLLEILFLLLKLSYRNKMLLVNLLRLLLQHVNFIGIQFLTHNRSLPPPGSSAGTVRA